MKKQLFFVILVLCSMLIAPCSANAQTIPPPYINYQAVLYDVNGANPNNPLTNQSFSTFVNINDELGNLLYREEHYASTDANGLITVKMGDGLYTAGPITNFNQINWGVGKYYLVVDFDINGTISSTAPEQLVTVPYSFYAGNAGNGMTSVLDNGDGTLTFTYANGATYTTPTLAGLHSTAGYITSESQLLSINGNDLSISGGNTITLPLNSLSSHGKQMFNSSGTFVVPAGITKVWVSMCGGGGGGGSGNVGGGGGGGGAASALASELAVTPLSSYLISVGIGCSGGTSGSAGVAPTIINSSSFGGLIICAGGGAGSAGTGSAGHNGQSGGTNAGLGGGAGSGLYGGGSGGAGGGSMFGSGANAVNYNSIGISGGKYGAGGSGGGGNSSTPGLNGGNGSSGFVLVEW